MSSHNAIGEKYWTVWRHKTGRIRERPIRFYVEARPPEEEGGLYTSSDGDLKIYPGPSEIEGAFTPMVRLRTTRNHAFDTEDFHPDRAPEAGMIPYDRLVDLYEREPDE